MHILGLIREVTNGVTPKEKLLSVSGDSCLICDRCGHASRERGEQGSY